MCLVVWRLIGFVRLCCVGVVCGWCFVYVVGERRLGLCSVVGWCLSCGLCGLFLVV